MASSTTTTEVAASATLDPNAQYVDLKLKDGDEIMRLKVPLGADPLAFATEYLQVMAENENAS